MKKLNIWRKFCFLFIKFVNLIKNVDVCHCLQCIFNIFFFQVDIIKELESSKKDLENKLESVSGELNDLSHTTSDLEKLVSDLTAKYASLKEEFSLAVENNEELEKQLSEINHRYDLEISDKNSQLSMLEEELQNLRKEKEETAVKFEDQVHHYAFIVAQLIFLNFYWLEFLFSFYD